MKKIIIGARGSKLSSAYVARVKSLILKNNIDIKEEQLSFKIIKTSGDIFHDKKLSEIGGKNLFCKEIEEKLLRNKIDIAVHSLKDMGPENNSSIIIGAYIKRNDPRDAFISLNKKNIGDLKKHDIICSSSRRRMLQTKLINQEVLFKDIRGNIDTRLKKVEEKKINAIILAVAGIQSLNLEKKITKIFTLDEMIPAAGQGIIAVQCRKKDIGIRKILSKINDTETNECAIAERHMLKEIGGDCHTAVGAIAILKNNKIKLKAQLFSDDGRKHYVYEITGERKDAKDVGVRVGKHLLKLAGSGFKKKL